jgi:hypothetical protein
MKELAPPVLIIVSLLLPWSPFVIRTHRVPDAGSVIADAWVVVGFSVPDVVRATFDQMVLPAVGPVEHALLVSIHMSALGVWPLVTEPPVSVSVHEVVAVTVTVAVDFQTAGGSPWPIVRLVTPPVVLVVNVSVDVDPEAVDLRFSDGGAGATTVTVCWLLRGEVQNVPLSFPWMA